jgi:protease IV
VRRGKNATLFSEWEPWTDEERAKVRSLNQAFYETFVAKTAEARKRTPQQIEAVAQGRVWTGQEALAAGLVDALGGLDSAIRAAREKAHIARGQEIQVVVMPQRKGLIETLLERQDEDVVARALGPAGASLLRWASALGDGGPIARVPFDLAVR